MPLIIFLICVSILLPSILLLPIMGSYLTVGEKKMVLPLSIGMAFFWGIAGFNFSNPKTDPDLIRYFEMLKNYANKPLFDSFNINYDNLYAVDIYFHFISKLGNQQFLPAISVFIFYFIILYILADYKIRTNVNSGIFSLFVFFVLGTINFPAIVNGIRSPIACVVFVLAVYRDVIQNKKNGFTILLHIIPVFIHFYSIVFIIMRLALRLKDKKVIIALSSSMVFLPELFNFLSNKLMNYSSGIIPSQVVYFINRGNMYFRWDNTEAGWASTVNNSTYYTLESWLYYAVAAYVLWVMYFFIKLRKHKEWEKENVFVIYLTTITLISFTMAAHTYIRFVTPLIACFCFMAFKMYVKKANHKYFILGSQAILSGLGFVGAYLNLHLLGSMVNLKDYFSNIIVSGALHYIIQKF